MKNLKTIAATVALTGILAANSFAGVMLSDFRSTEPEPCSETQKTGILMSDLTGIIVNLTAGLTGIIVNVANTDTDCSSLKRTGIIISD